MVWLVAACTLTDESFEPSSVTHIAGELSPDEERPLPEASDNTATTPVAGDSRPEQNAEAVPLDGPSVSSASETDDGASNPDADADAGSGSIDDEGSSEPDAMPPPSPVEQCSGNEFGASCYQLFGELAAWSLAEQRCVAWGGHLATVESSEEDAFISGWPALLGIPSGDGSGVWLGGTDAFFDGDFRWWNNGPLLFESWAPNQPDNGPGVDCIEKRNDGTSLWYDRRCSDALVSICERPL